MKSYFFLFLLQMLAFFADGQILFLEKSTSYRVEHTYQEGLSGGGISTVDFTGDGFADLSLASSSGIDFYVYQPTVNYFSKVPLFGLQLPDKVKQILWLDFNKDNRKDLIVSSEEGVNIYFNRGSLHFHELTDSLKFSVFNRTSFGIAAADVNNDGWLDLYITEKELAGDVSNHLMLNQDGVSFVEASSLYNVSDSNKKPYVPGFFDFDNDHYPDLYIAQDRMAVNSVYRNVKGEFFEDIGMSSQANETMDGMSISLIDLNRDGYQDFYVSNIEEGNRFFLNKQDLTYDEIADSLGISYNGIAWGTNFLDMDNDGDEDLYVAGSLPGIAYQNTIYESDDQGFSALNLPDMLQDTAVSYATAYADFNQDGRLDMIVNNAQPYASTLWENHSQGGKSIKVRLHGKNSNTDAIGSHIVAFQEGRRISKYTMAGEGYLAQNTEWLQFGLGDKNALDSLWVIWPMGDTTRYYGLSEGEVFDLIEPNIASWLYEGKTYACEFPVILRAGYAASYLWNTGDSLAVLEINEPGLYVLRSKTWSGQEVMDSVSIQSPAPISFDIEVTQNPCIGAEKASISVKSNSIYTVLWEDGYIGSTRDQLTAANYALYIYDERGCGKDTVVAVTSPENSDYQVFIRQGSSEKLEALVLGGKAPYEYLWIFGMDTISTEQQVYPESVGVYEVFVSDSQGCITSFKYNYLGAHLSLADEAVSISPLPFSNKVSIRTADGVIQQVEVFDLQGKLHFFSNEVYEGQGDFLFGELSKGLYILRIMSKDNVYYEKIYKK